MRKGDTLKIGKVVEKVSRRQLADPQLGMKYEDRLKMTKIEVKTSGFKVKNLGNGYAKLVR